MDRLKGLKYENGLILWMNTIPTTRELAITLNLLIEQINSEVDLITYYVDNSKITYALIPMYSREFALIRVDYSNESIETQRCGVFFNQPTFLALLPRYMYSKESADRIYFEIEVVTNFCRETLKFAYPRTYGNKSKSNIRVQDNPNSSPTDSHAIYLNNIRFFDGSDFYFDYTDSDNCFLYSSTANDMQCVKAKNGYSILNGKTVGGQDCATAEPSKLLLVPNLLYAEC